MKKLYIIFALLIIPRVFYAQTEQWSDPVPITDSLTDNRNVTLSTFQGMYNMGDTLYACWEKSTDTLSTALYCRCLLPLGDPFLLLSQPNVHFKNPKIYQYHSGDTLFGVYFQTNMNGNWDIYYVCYLRNGTVSPMIPVRTSGQDETNYFSDISQESLTEMVWEQNGRILYKRSNTDTIQFDQNDCHKPLIGNNHIFWTKNNAGNVTIYFSQRDFFTGIWGASVLVIGGVPYENLSIGNDTHGSMVNGDLVFEQKEGSHWRLMDFDPSSLIQYPFKNFSYSNNIYPSYTGVFIYTDHPDYLDGTFKTFASDTTGNMEIWVNSAMYSDYINISNYGNTDTHPQLFNFYTPGTNHVYDIWESYHNGHWQLWMTNLDIFTGIEDRSKSDIGPLVIHPNPFREETTIDFFQYQPGSVSVTVYNSLGNKVIMLKPMKEGTGKFSIKWDGKDENGIKMAAGIYFCILITNSKSVQKKIVIF